MKHQAFFSLEDKNKIIKVSFAVILLGSLRVKNKQGYSYDCITPL